MSNALDPEQLKRAIEGDLQAFFAVRTRPQEEIIEARNQLSHLTLSSEALARVVRSLLNGKVAKQEVQSWASFMRRGYIAGTMAPRVFPIDIAYTVEREDEIALIVSRLDELGDVVDGEIDANELVGMLHQLRGTA